MVEITPEIGLAIYTFGLFTLTFLVEAARTAIGVVIAVWVLRRMGVITPRWQDRRLY